LQFHCIIDTVNGALTFQYPIKLREEHKMGKYAFVLTVGLVVLSANVAQATLVSFATEELSSWSESGAVITQAISTVIPIDVIMTADADSTFTLTSTTTNESGFTWTGYILTLDPAGDVTFVPGMAGSTKFQTVLYPTLTRLEFWAPLEVQPGQVVTLQFDLHVPDGPPYTFSLTHTPIPEPATFALLGLGTAVLLTQRKR